MWCQVTKTTFAPLQQQPCIYRTTSWINITWGVQTDDNTEEANGSAHGLMVIVIRNGHANLSSNPEQSFSPHANSIGKGINLTILPTVMGK